MRKLIYIISSVLLLAFASGANADRCWDFDFTDCKVKAEQGNAGAQVSLGLMYARGEGVPQDYEKAVEWWSRAAEQGNSRAQFKLGLVYSNGEGVPQDYVMAHMFADISAENGSEDGINHRNILAKKMTPSQIAEAQRLAREWMEKHQ